MKRPFFFVLFLLGCLSVYAANRIVDQVVWVIGDEPILQSDIETEIMNRKYNRQPIQGDPNCVIPEEIAIQKLFIAQAKLDSLSAPESSVNMQVDGRIKFLIQQIGSEEKVEEYFKKPLSKIKQEMASTVRDQLLVQEMQQKIITSVRITPADVQRYYKTIPRDSIPTIPEQIELQIISIAPEITAAEEERCKSQLRDFREKIQSGSYEFSTLAILYSEDRGSALNGGELGFMSKGQLVPEFANMAFSLHDPKVVSRIVQSEFGYHIIQLIEKKGDQVNCRHILLIPKVGYQQKEEAKQYLDSIAIACRNGETNFADEARSISEDEQSIQNGGVMINPATGSTKFQLQELPPEIAKVAHYMEVGEISKPFIYKDQKGKEKAAIVRLKSKTKAHKAHPDTDYQALKDLVSSRKNMELVDKWIRDKQKDIYIYIAPDFRHCEFQYPNWIQ